MTSMEDPKYIFVQIALGVLVSLAHGPLMALFVLTTLVAVMVTPYVILGARVGFRKSLQKEHRQITWGILRGRSNVPPGFAILIVLALIVCGFLFGMFGLVVTEVFVAPVFGLELRQRSSLVVLVLTGGLFLTFKALQYASRRANQMNAKGTR